MVSGIFRRVVKPAQLKLRELVSRAIDRRLGIVTTDEVIVDATGGDIAEYRRLQRALGWNGAFRLARRLDLGPGDAFMDIGCGAGRVACVLGRRPVGRVIGVELDPQLADIARRNAAGLRGRRCPVEILEADATLLDVPDDVTCVYMYNPFGGELLEAALMRLLESVDRRPRRVRLVYPNPREHDVVVGVGRFRPSGTMSFGWRPTETWARTQRVQFYEAEPALAGQTASDR